MDNKLKYSIKTITLYEIGVNNDILIMSTIHHIIILLFNYYAIIHLEFLKTQFNHFENIFELIQHNIEVCQVITFFTVFLVFYCSTPTIEKNKYIDRNLISIMCFSFLTKMSIVIYQYYMNRYLYIKYTSKDQDEFGLFYMFIYMSYVIRFVTLLCIITIIILIQLSFTYDKCYTETIQWSKKYKITFTEENINDGSEDV